MEATSKRPPGWVVCAARPAVTTAAARTPHKAGFQRSIMRNETPAHQAGSAAGSLSALPDLPIYLLPSHPLRPHQRQQRARLLVLVADPIGRAQIQLPRGALDAMAARQ